MTTPLGTAYGQIDLDTTGVLKALETTEKKLKGFASKMASLGQTMVAVGTNLRAVSDPLLQLGGLAAQAAIQFESAFAGVRKTVDESEEGYQQLRDAIDGMATSMDNATAALPDAHEELAGIMEMAGQLGVSGAENLENFTDTIAKLTMATNLTAESAATELARFANITQMEMGNIDELGATIVALGNNMATTEAEIVSMAQRLAAAGNQVGLSEAEIMGLSAAMSSVGIAAEAGGSAMSRVLFDLDQAVRTAGTGVIDNTARIATSQEDLILLQDKLAKAQEKLAEATTEAERIKAQRVVESTNAQIAALSEQMGWMEESNGKLADMSDAQLKRVAEIAGMTTDAFSEMWGSDTDKALSAFVAGLGELKDEGADLAGVLEALGFTNLRVRDSLMRLAGSGDLLADAFEISNEAWEANTALQEEAEKRMETTEAKLNLLKNTLNGLAIVVGDALLPIINETLGVVTPLIRKVADGVKTFTKANPQVTKLAGVFGALVAALGPVVVIGGKVVGFIGMIANPVTAAVAAIGALAFAFETNFLGIRDVVESVLTPVLAFVQLFVDQLSGVDLGDQLDVRTNLRESLESLFGADAQQLYDQLIDFIAAIRIAVTDLQNLFGGAVPLRDLLAKWFNIDVTPLETAFATLRAGVETFWATYIQPVLDTLFGDTDIVQALATFLGVDITAAAGVAQPLLDVINEVIRLVEERIGKLGGLFTDIVTGKATTFTGPEALEPVFEALGPERFEAAFSATQNKAQAFVGGMQRIFGGLFGDDTPAEDAEFDFDRFSVFTQYGQHLDAQKAMLDEKIAAIQTDYASVSNELNAALEAQAASETPEIFQAQIDDLEAKQKKLSDMLVTQRGIDDDIVANKADTERKLESLDQSTQLLLASIQSDLDKAEQDVKAAEVRLAQADTTDPMVMEGLEADLAAKQKKVDDLKTELNTTTAAYLEAKADMESAQFDAQTVIDDTAAMVDDARNAMNIDPAEMYETKTLGDAFAEFFDIDLEPLKTAWADFQVAWDANIVPIFDRIREIGDGVKAAVSDANAGIQNALQSLFAPETLYDAGDARGMDDLAQTERGPDFSTIANRIAEGLLSAVKDIDLSETASTIGTKLGAALGALADFNFETFVSNVAATLRTKFDTVGEKVNLGDLIDWEKDYGVAFADQFARIAGNIRSAFAAAFAAAFGAGGLTFDPAGGMAGMDDIAAQVADGPAAGSLAGIAQKIATAFEGMDLGNVETALSNNLTGVVKVGLAAATTLLGGTGPGAVVIGLAGAVVAAVESDFLGIRTQLEASGILPELESAFNGLKTSIQNIISRIFGGGSEPVDAADMRGMDDIPQQIAGGLEFGDVLAPVGDALKKIGDGLGGFFVNLEDADVQGMLKTVGDALALFGATVGGIAIAAFDLAATTLSTVLPPLGDAVKHFIDAIASLGEADPAGFLEEIGGGLDALITAIASSPALSAVAAIGVGLAFGKIASALSTIFALGGAGFIGTIATKLATLGASAFAAFGPVGLLAGAITALVLGLKHLANEGILDNLIGLISGVLSKLGSEMSRIFTQVGDTLKTMILSMIRGVVSAIGDMQLPGVDVSGTLADLDRQILDAASRLTGAYQAGVGMADDLKAGLEVAGQGIGENIGALTGKMSEAFEQQGSQGMLGFYQRIAEMQPGEDVMTTMQAQMTQLLGGNLASIIEEQGAAAGQKYLDALAAEGFGGDMIQGLIDGVAEPEAGLEVPEIAMPTPEVTMNEEELRTKTAELAGKIPQHLTDALKEAMATEGTDDDNTARQAIYDWMFETPDGQALLEAAKPLGDAGAEAILTGIGDAMLEAGVDRQSWKWSGIVDGWKNDLMTALEAHSPSRKFMPTGEAIAGGVALGVENQQNAPLAALTTALTNMLTTARTQAAKFAAIGDIIMDTLKARIDSKIVTLAETMRGAAKAMLDAVNDELGIASPSKVFASVGDNITAGLLESLGANTPGVQAALLGLLTPPSTDAVVRGATAGSSTTHHYYQQDQSQQINFNPQYADRPDSSQLKADFDFVQMRAKR